jgi:hypothetical protein
MVDATVLAVIAQLVSIDCDDDEPTCALVLKASRMDEQNVLTVAATAAIETSYRRQSVGPFSSVEDFYERIILKCSPDIFKSHFRMKRSTFEVNKCGTYICNIWINSLPTALIKTNNEFHTYLLIKSELI